MACTNPSSGWFSAVINPTGKRSVTFSAQDGLLDRPVDVPCGKCTGCKADQSLWWSIRAYHESQLHDANCFLTLTYDDEHLPSDGLVHKEDLQKFFKRLRHKYKVRYIACGEYGETTRRPHFHALIFGQDFNHARYRVDIDDTQYTHTQLRDIWGMGHVSIAPCSFASIMYVCGYVHKKIGSDEDTYFCSSRRPNGIGHEWLNRYWDDLRRTGTCTIEGQEFAIPPRYLVWKEDQFKEVKKLRKEYAVKAKESIAGNIWAMRNRELNRNALLKQRKRGKL